MANERGFVLVKDASNKTVASWVIKSDSKESDEILALVTGEITDDLASAQKSLGRGVTFTRTDAGNVSKGKAPVAQKKTVDQLVAELKKNLPEIKDPSLKAAAGQAISQHELSKAAASEFGAGNDEWITQNKAAQAPAIANATARATSPTDPRSALQSVWDGTATPQAIDWSPEADAQLVTQLNRQEDPLKKEALGYDITLARLRAHAQLEQRRRGER